MEGIRITRNIPACTIYQHSLKTNNTLNPLNPDLNPICYLLALLAHHFLHVSRIMVKSLTLRLLMSYIYGAHILDVSRSHNDAPQSVGHFWTSDQLVAETSTWQHTTLTTDKYPCPRCGRSPAEIVGSNHTGGMNICLLWVSCVVK